MALMLLIFYGLFLPVGLIFRLFGRDPLDKRPDPTMSSYWHVRGAPRPSRAIFDYTDHIESNPEA